MGLFQRKKESVEPAPCACRKGRADCGTERRTGGTLTVKVLGMGCASCQEQFEQAKRAVKDMGLAAQVEYITDLQKIMAYSAMSMPAIVVNEKVVSTGKVLKAREVERLLAQMEG